MGHEYFGPGIRTGIGPGKAIRRAARELRTCRRQRRPRTLSAFSVLRCGACGDPRGANEARGACPDCCARSTLYVGLAPLSARLTTATLAASGAYARAPTAALSGSIRQAGFHT